MVEGQPNATSNNLQSSTNATTTFTARKEEDGQG
jgi:hypothetical protein